MSLLGRIFGRREPPPTPRQIIDRRTMNEDWRVGDLACCVMRPGMWWSPGSPFDPKDGDILRVSHILDGVHEKSDSLIIALGFHGKPADILWCCHQFRKIRPDHREADAEFTAQIKRVGRKVEPA